MYARLILKKISEKVVVMINKDWGGILEFVGVTSVMRGYIAPKSPPIRENLFLYEFKYERVKIFVDLDPLIHILI